MRYLLTAIAAVLVAATPAHAQSKPQAAIRMPIAPGLWTDTFRKIPCAKVTSGYVFDGKRWGSFYFYGPNSTLGPNAELEPITATKAVAGGFTQMQFGGYDTPGTMRVKSLDANRALYRVNSGGQESDEELIRCAFNTLSPRMQAGLRKHAPAIAN
jgi:hypothetical protein